ncbi:DUF2798 domain-containing protein [Pseudooceanicola atlanticus]|uniref:DUF2798 domain-containing protein n=1 Tax=Pseudooceanicola atlanticus TaxID=1461694 RepID=A0A0A0EJC1_9RHOB|nr:DUF2798 domain-containing protein [Pseudooceanicola atlanticus]KGM49262.1 hypothetical protein ATO9_04300 [Pseudooceanicola atlanticus]
MTRNMSIHRLTGSFVMSAFMSMALSGVFSLLEFGVSWTWLRTWGQSILIALPIAFVLDMILGEKLRALADDLADKAAKAWS